MFNWAIGRDIIEMSPVLKVTPPSEERKRERTLT
jgi:hypothetical protein